MRVMIELSSEVNAMYPTYSTKLGFCTRKIIVGIPKIDGSYLDIFKMIIADYLVKNKLEWVRFFYGTFLLANISLEIVSEMLFLTFSKANVRFAKREFVWRTYMAAETLLTTKRVEIINKREFAAVALNRDDKIFVVYIAALAKPKAIPIYSLS